MDAPKRLTPENRREIAQIFGRLGILGFGGPLATMAMMEEETSRKRGWVDHAQFAEIYALCKMLPGPAATQMAIYLGRLRAGWAGGLLSGFLFILPSFTLVLLLSWIYVHSGLVKRAEGLFIGMQAAALAVILLSTIQLGRPYRKDRRAWAIVAAALGLTLVFPAYEPLVILGFGLCGVLAGRIRPRLRTGWGESAVGLGALGGGLALKSTIPQLFWMCFKAGAFVFGTGLAIVPVLEADAVTRYGWLTHSEFIDGLAIGQITPGPVVITSTFIGYKAAGLAGACVATVGMFLPAFVNILVIVPRVWSRVSGTEGARRFSSWAIPAVIGSILGATGRLGAGVLFHPLAGALFVAALAVSWRWKTPSWMMIPAAGAVAQAIAALG